MSGERIHWDSSYEELGRNILHFLKERLNRPATNRLVISIFGESGSGKTICALAIQKALEETGIRSAILHMDGYFRLPPKKNHEARLANLHHVGPSEVNLEMLSEHIRLFCQGCKQLDVPVTDYASDTFRLETVHLEGVQVLLAEGTYLGMIQNADCRIYLSADYTQTLQNRQKRGRDTMDPFVEKVLDIEHQLVTHSALDADLVIDKYYTLHPNQKHAWPNQDSLSGRSGT